MPWNLTGKDPWTVKPYGKTGYIGNVEMILMGDLHSQDLCGPILIGGLIDIGLCHFLPVPVGSGQPWCPRTPCRGHFRGTPNYQRRDP
jgi:hypothetical protein